MDIRESCQRTHENDMQSGSRELLKALWNQHPRILSQLTGRMVGP